MAEKSIISNAKLDAIVAAIVAKGGGTAPMTADQMAAAIAAIPAGVDTLGGMAKNTLTDYTFDADVSDIRGYLFYTCTSIERVTIPTSANCHFYEAAFRQCTALERVSIPNASRVDLDSSAFNTCRSLEAFEAPFFNVGQTAFKGCSQLQFVKSDFGPITTKSGIATQAFFNCSSLALFDIANAPNIGGSAFASCPTTLTIVIRDDTKVGVLSGTNSLPTNFAGAIYVPDALVDTYKAASNWSAFAAFIHPLSEYVEPAA